jgi:hypothetical protein
MTAKNIFIMNKNYFSICKSLKGDDLTILLGKIEKKVNHVNSYFVPFTYYSQGD